MLVASLLLLQTAAPPPSDTLGPNHLRHRNGRVPRSVTAVFTATPPRIDGKLDDPAWQTATPQDGFRRDVPSDGNPAAENTEVRVLYDHEALYIGARLYDRSARLVSHRLRRRDSFDDFNDAFFVLIDSYHDHQSQFIFGVTPAGEKRDMAAGGDGDFSSADISWDPVWDVKTTRDSLGWIAEERIPFSQLRFPQAAEQVWGIQFRRDIVRAGEAVDWQWSSRNEPGQVSKYGHLLGLKNIPAPRRVEVLPYVRSFARFTQGADKNNPFDDGRVANGGAGLDLRYGLTSDLTLNASVNPDFGQVEADPAVVNLTAFETFFEERRPLFVEGSSIFAFGDRTGEQQFFYSRRIGRQPSLSAAGSALYVDEPTSTSILGAVKLSGKTRSGWSIGALDALTSRESARLSNGTSSTVTKQPIEPLANYGVVRLKRDLNGGASGYGMIFTSVNRDLTSGGFQSLRSSAFAGAVDFSHRWNQNSYALRGWFGGSAIQGDSLAMQDAQLSSARYYQRPDQDYARYRSDATSLRGVAGQLNFAKESGAWVYQAESRLTSPGFELNDAGFQTAADRIRFRGGLGRRWVSPGRLARQASVSVAGTQELNFGGVRFGEVAEVQTGISTKNFWDVFGYFAYTFRGLDDRATRGGPLMEIPDKWVLHGGFQTDGRKLFATGLFGTYSRDRRGSSSTNLFLSLRYQTRGNLYFSVAPSYDHTTSAAFYVGAYGDLTATPTFGQRYVFAGLEQHTLSVSARLNWFFTPSLTLQLYAQPFVATGKYTNFKSFAAPRTYDFDQYGRNGSTVAFDPTTEVYTLDSDGLGPAPAYSFGTPDFRVRSFRSNAVLRWEYTPGSTLFLVWNQNRYNSSTDPRFRALKDLGNIFQDDMQNVFLIKVNYYLSR